MPTALRRLEPSAVLGGLLPPSSPLAVSRIGTLHRRLMRNYRSWAVHLGVPAQCAAASDVSQNKVADLALWLE